MGVDLHDVGSNHPLHPSKPNPNNPACHEHNLHCLEYILRVVSALLLGGSVDSGIHSLVHRPHSVLLGSVQI